MEEIGIIKYYGNLPKDHTESTSIVSLIVRVGHYSIKIQYFFGDKSPTLV